MSAMVITGERQAFGEGGEEADVLQSSALCRVVGGRVFHTSGDGICVGAEQRNRLAITTHRPPPPPQQQQQQQQQPDNWEECRG